MEETGDEALLETSDFVADLRKELKLRGLAITGNKNELIERLQEAMHLSKDVDQTEPRDEVDEDEVLGDEHLSGEDSKPTEDHRSVNKEEIFGAVTKSETEILIKPIVKVKPSPKQQMNNTKVDKTSSKATGVIRISQPVIQQTTPVKTSEKSVAEDLKKKAVITSINNSIPEKRLSVGKDKLSAANVINKLQARAERFGLTDKSNVTTSRNVETLSSSRYSYVVLFSGVQVLDLEKLRNRAERFGQSVSEAMKQIEERERMLKRKKKFGSSTSGSSEERSLFFFWFFQKKKKRLERFGDV
ncbi:uncharacterized protein LOC143233680 isoform X2 [Tachypleus tridentatus]|uniref:uncharacterized protein LOC143233680 isoform X2 n=1 Tax=Tachypleus tridentatus TaxID=6853 RepID=UPI003FD49FC6